MAKSKKTPGKIARKRKVTFRYTYQQKCSEKGSGDVADASSAAVSLPGGSAAGGGAGLLACWLACWMLGEPALGVPSSYVLRAEVWTAGGSAPQRATG